MSMKNVPWPSQSLHQSRADTWREKQVLDKLEVKHFTELLASCGEGCVFVCVAASHGGRV